MVQPITKPVATGAFILPNDSSTIYNLKIDRESQKFFIDDEALDYGLFDEVTFRTLMLYNKLVAYDSDFKVKNETNLFTVLNQAKDAQGCASVDKYDEATGKGAAVCGRVVWKNVTDKFSEEKKLANKKKANWYTMLFGIASIPGKNPVLCDFRVPGGTQIDINRILDKVREDKKDIHKAEIRIKVIETDKDWPEIEVTPEFSRDLPVSGLEDFFDSINSYVDEHNARIEAKAEKYKKFGGVPYKPKSPFSKKKY